jgi:hypothetical protein
MAALRGLGWLVLVLLLACGGRKPAPAKERAPSPSVTAPAPVRAPDLSKEPAAVRAAATALLERWQIAQNQGDAATYFALYAPKAFKGLKRTHRGTRVENDFSSWKKDRGAMFARSFEVAVENVAIDSWLDEDAQLKNGIVRVRFLQRCRQSARERRALALLSPKARSAPA